MPAPLKLPAVLAFTVLGAAAAATSCGDSKPTSDAAICNLCVYVSVDNGNCPPPTCATGSNDDVCPNGCELQPIA